MSNLILRFIAGPYQGAIYPLPESGEISIGRGLEQSIILDDSLSSRHHALIYGAGHKWSVRDMGSTNGTFVNGERQEEAVSLSVGDTLLIGSSILRLDTASDDEPLPDASAVRAQMAQKASDNRQASSSTMSGAIDQVPVVDVLQLLFNLKKSGNLHIKSAGHDGIITLDGGLVGDAAIDGKTTASATKSFYRIMRWTKGQFEFIPTEVEIDEARRIQSSSEGLLLESMRQMDEIARLSDKLPEESTFLEIPVPLEPPLSQLTPEQLDVLQLVHNHSQFIEVLDHSQASDLAVSEIIIQLLEGGYIVAAN